MPENAGEKLLRYSLTIARDIITGTPFEAVNWEALENPAFLFGNEIKNSDEILFKEESKWLNQVGDLLMFLPDMEWSYPLAHLQRLCAPRQLD